MLSIFKKKYTQEQLINFYKNEIPNINNMFLTDMWNLSEKDKEAKHDYIQWMFPTKEKSDFNRRAPVLESIDIEVMKDSKMVMSNMRKSVYVFLDFLGFTLNEDNNICIQEEFETKSKNWLRPNNHNFKRISRLLTFLKLFGFDEIYNNFFDKLEELYKKYPEIIGEKSYNYWKITKEI